mmetsp:Transcript_7971/g.31546  ORF Transcript_7971/g.31546 Transcript_7971/m.31546 type:complete len:352 (-) Transcript_7971:51-1106(-)
MRGEPRARVGGGEARGRLCRVRRGGRVKPGRGRRVVDVLAGAGDGGWGEGGGAAGVLAELRRRRRPQRRHGQAPARARPGVRAPPPSAASAASSASAVESAPVESSASRPGRTTSSAGPSAEAGRRRPGSHRGAPRRRRRDARQVPARGRLGKRPGACTDAAVAARPIGASDRQASRPRRFRPAKIRRVHTVLGGIQARVVVGGQRAGVGLGVLRPDVAEPVRARGRSGRRGGTFDRVSRRRRSNERSHGVREGGQGGGGSRGFHTHAGQTGRAAHRGFRVQDPGRRRDAREPGVAARERRRRGGRRRRREREATGRQVEVAAAADGAGVWDGGRRAETGDAGGVRHATVI